MNLNNPLYKNQGIHVISTIFTVEKGIVKVLLIKRNNEPFLNKWALVGGGLYNNEDLEVGINREIFEKTGIKQIKLSLSNVYGKVNRASIKRLVAISYIGVINCEKVRVLKKTLKTNDAAWFSIHSIPELAYDHNEIILDSFEILKRKIVDSNILKSLFPNNFTIPELQKTYEAILNRKFDRRNFRRKLLSLNLIEDINEKTLFEGKKPAKLYRYNNIIEKKEIF